MDRGMGTAFGLGGYTPSLSRLCLQQVRAMDSSTHPVMQAVGARVLVASAVGLAVIEAVGHLVVGSAATAVQTMKRITCGILTGGFVALWVATGWINSYLFSFSPVKSTLFFVIQLSLFWARPRQSVDQWRLWRYIVTQLPKIANRMASLSFSVDQSVNRIASWNHIRYHTQTTAALLRFSLATSTNPNLLMNPRAIANDYDSVHCWPRPIYKKAWCWVKDHPRYVAVSLSLLALAAYHYSQPGIESRELWVKASAQSVYRGTERYAVTLGYGLSTGWDWTGATLWRWWTKAPSLALMKQNDQLIEAVKGIGQQISSIPQCKGGGELLALRGEVEQLRRQVSMDTCPAGSSFFSSL